MDISPQLVRDRIERTYAFDDEPMVAKAPLE
jgi:hypothetical protein